MGENLRSRGLNDPSAMTRLKISDVGTFCLGCEDSAPENGSRWDGKRAS